MSQSIAVINAGSSSIKFALYDAANEEICLFSGQIGGIGVAPYLKVADPKGEIVEERAFTSEGFDHDAAMREILSVGAKLLRRESVAAFGHRVVHGGVGAVTRTKFWAHEDWKSQLRFRPRWRLATSGKFRLGRRGACGGM